MVVDKRQTQLPRTNRGCSEYSYSVQSKQQQRQQHKNVRQGRFGVILERRLAANGKPWLQGNNGRYSAKMGVGCGERRHACVVEEHPPQPSVLSQFCDIWLSEARGCQSIKLLVEEDNGGFHCQADLTPCRPAISRSNSRSGSLIWDAASASGIQGLSCAQVERHIAPNRHSAEIQTAEAPRQTHREKLMSGCRAEFFRAILGQSRWILQE